MYYAGVAETIGVKVNKLTPAQVKEVWPLCNTEGLLGAIQHPDDGYIQPADLTQAFAKGARNRGAEIYRNTTVISIERTTSGEWLVKTDKGDITCEHIVSASGNFARQTGKMLGLDIPVIPVEHQYIVTEPHPAVQERHAKGLPEMGVLREADSSWYLREEAGGFILGPYEKGAPVCYVDGPHKDSEYELFQEDLDRLAPHIEAAIVRVPAFGEVGIKKVYNGAIAYTPDGSPIIGPAWDKKNFWLNEGHSFGVTASGGAGWQLAEWIVEGEPSIDMMGVDPRRFGPYATRGYLKAKNEEAYANVFTPHYPDEERAAASVLRKTKLRRRDGKFVLRRRHARQPLPVADRFRQILVIPLLHHRLVVEQVHLRRTAHHVQINDMLRLRRKLCGTRCHRRKIAGGRVDLAPLPQQTGQPQASQSRPCPI